MYLENSMSKLTIESVQQQIADILYEDKVLFNQRMMVVHLLLANGFVLYGKTPVRLSMEETAFALGVKKDMAYKNTFDQLYEMELYRAMSNDQPAELDYSKIVNNITLVRQCVNPVDNILESIFEIDILTDDGLVRRAIRVPADNPEARTEAIKEAVNQVFSARKQ